MRAVLLAAGMGTRLASVTKDEIPKILVRVAGKPLLARQLRYLERQGFDEVAINVHHQSDQVHRFLASFDTQLSIHVSDEPELLGTAGALMPLAELLREPFVLLYGDVVTDSDLQLLLSTHCSNESLATLAYYMSEEHEDKGVLELDAGGRVIGFVEKGDASPGCQPINAGVYALDPQIVEFVGPGADFGFDIWPALVAAGMPIESHRLEGYLADVGTPAALDRVEADLLAGVLEW